MRKSVTELTRELPLSIRIFRDLPVTAKLEKHEALDNVDAIVEAADGLMVARGDLGVETPREKIPKVQKDLIRKSHSAGKPVITATQMLHSMVDSPRPTRAEVTDVANAMMIAMALKSSLRTGVVKKGQTVVITAGVPINRQGTTNLIKVEVLQ